MLFRFFALSVLVMGSATSSAYAADADAAMGKSAFATCSICHSDQKDVNLVGPSLFDIVGRKAGTERGFNYSTAMKTSGLTWNEASLDTFIASPQATVHGTKMPYAGLKDAKRRHALIDYLKTLHP